VSVWRIAVGAQAPAIRAEEAKTPIQHLLTALGALVRWLPAEVVAGYAAVVTAMQPEQVEGGLAKLPSVSWAAWLVALVATPVLIFLLSKAAKNNALLGRRVGLSIPAFILWSASVPHSVWEKLDAFRENRPVFLFVLLLVTSAFTALAQWLVPDNT
jgi:hypothetical protein